MVKTGKLRSGTAQKLKRWKKGYSSDSNPETSRFRQAARSRFFSRPSGKCSGVKAPGVHAEHTWVTLLGLKHSALAETRWQHNNTLKHTWNTHSRKRAESNKSISQITHKKMTLVIFGEMEEVGRSKKQR